MWLVTREINDYNQEGEYFVAVFTDKPSFKQLKETINRTDVVAGKLTRGGGRQDGEYEWFNLHEVQDGEMI